MNKINVLEHNSQYVVCLKPAGMVSQETADGKNSLAACLEEQLQHRVYPVHRLDLETSGLMVYACSQKAAAALSEQIQNGEFHKEYLAVLQGRPAPAMGTLEDLLLHDQRKNKAYVVQRKRKGVREAKLTYVCLAESNGMSLVQVRLCTGRTHQIRVQFASRGTPLRGDRRYGGGKGEFSLASVRLSFLNPATREKCEFVDLPEFADAFVWKHMLETI